MIAFCPNFLAGGWKMAEIGGFPTIIWKTEKQIKN